MPVIVDEARDERSCVLALAIRGEEKSPRHGHDNLVVDHLDDEATAFRHNRSPFGMTNSAPLPDVPSPRENHWRQEVMPSRLPHFELARFRSKVGVINSLRATIVLLPALPRDTHAADELAAENLDGPYARAAIDAP